MNIIRWKLDHTNSRFVDPYAKFLRPGVDDKRNRVGGELVKLHMRIQVRLRQEEAVSRMRMIPPNDLAFDPAFHKFMRYLSQTLGREDT